MAGAARAAGRAAQVLAVKGLGGYHLAVDAGSEPAAAAAAGPQAPGGQAVRGAWSPTWRPRGTLCEVDEAGEALLTSAGRPIVLLPGGPGAAGRRTRSRRATASSASCCPTRRCTICCSAAVGRPIVLTSGNVSDEPIAYRDDDALARLAGIADAFLTHDRPIHIRTDDSVVRPLRRPGRAAPPLPRLRAGAARRCRPPARRPVLACGGELKNTFCLAREDRAFVSQHIGDLENFETLRSFTEGIEHFRRLFGITPQVVAHDLHPEYLSTKYALDLDGADLVGVQHHHAHIASCLADNGEDGPVIGVAFDGTGYGTDGTIWGGEFLLADLAGFERAGHLAGVPMPGGAAAIRQPWRMAAAYLDAAFPASCPPAWPWPRATRRPGPPCWPWPRRGINAPVTSSAGRLFDAVAALLGVRDTINYEGQAAIELEQLADPAERGATRPADPAADDRRPGRCAGRGADLVRAAAEDLLAGVAPGGHRGPVPPRAWRPPSWRSAGGCGTGPGWARWRCPAACSRTCCCSASRGPAGGAGFRVLTHARVPPNDGGISLGQAVVAAARDRRDGC